MSWDVTQDVGRDKSMNRTDKVVMVSGDWTLERSNWYVADDAIIWARHYGCREDEVDEYGRLSPRQRFGEWFPRDNALIGKCCYCGDEVPDHFITLFKMHNWEWIADWEPIALSRRGDCV